MVLEDAVHELRVRTMTTTEVAEMVHNSVKIVNKRRLLNPRILLAPGLIPIYR